MSNDGEGYRRLPLFDHTRIPRGPGTISDAMVRLDVSYCTRRSQLIHRAELYDRVAVDYEPGGRFETHKFAEECATEHRAAAVKLRAAADTLPADE